MIEEAQTWNDALSALYRASGLDRSVASVTDYFNNTDNALSSDAAITTLPRNPNYFIRIFQQTTNLDVVANSPADFSFAFQNDWVSVASVFGNSVGSLVNSKTRNNLDLMRETLKSTGNYVQPRFTSIQVWTGTHPLEFTLKLFFKASTDAEKQVVEPVRKLTQMGAPDTFEYGGLAGNMALQSPGPNMWNIGKALASGSLMPDYAIYLRLGRRVVIPGLVITQLQGRWDAFYTSDGWPISAEVDVTFRTFMTFSRKELSQMLFKNTSTMYSVPSQ